MAIYIGPELHALERNRTRFPRSGCALSQLLERKTSARPAHIIGKFLGNFLLQTLLDGITMFTMRSSFAMLLVALFSFSLIGPAVFASNGDSSLPACCRRGGKHGCAMTASQSASSSGHSVQAARCRFFPPAKAIPPGRTVNLPGVSRAISAGLLSHPASRSQTEAVYRISYSRAGQERAPPTSPL
jgi:hypothetical protein